MIEAVIFDFDGVILDSEPLHYQACSSVFQTIGLAISYEDYVEHYLGLSDKDMFPKFLADHNYKITQAATEKLMQQKEQAYTQIIKNSAVLPMIKDVDAFIYKTAKVSKKMAVCSGSTREEIGAALTNLKQGSLRSYFDVLVTAEDVRHGKPDPEGYLLTAKRLNIAPEQCLVIEDTPHGVDAAKAAGMQTIGLLTTYTKQQLSNANQVITGFSELVQSCSPYGALA